jgi:hypothetical protein
MKPVFDDAYQTEEVLWIKFDEIKQPIYDDSTYPSVGRRYYDDDQG